MTHHDLMTVAHTIEETDLDVATREYLARRFEAALTLPEPEAARFHAVACAPCQPAPREVVWPDSDY
jgi:hypothetical protein